MDDAYGWNIGPLLVESIFQKSTGKSSLKNSLINITLSFIKKYPV